MPVLSRVHQAVVDGDSLGLLIASRDGHEGAQLPTRSLAVFFEVQLQRLHEIRGEQTHRMCALQDLLG